jgi:hypothetical protein
MRWDRVAIPAAEARAFQITIDRATTVAAQSSASSVKWRLPCNPGYHAMARRRDFSVIKHLLKARDLGAQCFTNIIH